MKKMFKGMCVLVMSMLMTSNMYAQITPEDITKIVESRNNVTVAPTNAYIIWKGTREDIKSNQIVLELEIKNDTLVDYITPQYERNVRDVDGNARCMLDIGMTNFYKEIMVIQDNHELNYYRGKTEEIKSGEMGKFYLIFWASDQNQSIDVVIEEEIHNLSLKQIPQEILELLPTRPAS